LAKNVIKSRKLIHELIMPHADDRKQMIISKLNYPDDWVKLKALLGELSPDEVASIVQWLADGLSPEQIARKIREIRGDNEPVRGDCDHYPSF
jgi:hypothetical protein